LSVRFIAVLLWNEVNKRACIGLLEPVPSRLAFDGGHAEAALLQT